MNRHKKFGNYVFYVLILAAVVIPIWAFIKFGIFHTILFIIEIICLFAGLYFALLINYTISKILLELMNKILRIFGEEPDELP